MIKLEPCQMGKYKKYLEDQGIKWKTIGICPKGNGWYWEDKDGDIHLMFAHDGGYVELTKDIKYKYAATTKENNWIGKDEDGQWYLMRGIAL